MKKAATPQAQARVLSRATRAGTGRATPSATSQSNRRATTTKMKSPR